MSSTVMTCVCGCVCVFGLDKLSQPHPWQKTGQASLLTHSHDYRFMCQQFFRLLVERKKNITENIPSSVNK